MPRILRSLVILLAAVFCLPAFVNAAVGYTPGSFKVSDIGAATYSIPIAVPPGTAGMQPNLSLTYNSQSGNGLVGMGFSLQGLSAITRCPTIIATEGISGGVNLSNTNDRFCLDGQKLILVSGTYGAAGSEYRTELDSLTKITASGTGPQNFIAKTKSGQTIEYGVTADARVLASGTTTPLVWAADKIADTAGNYLMMSYCNYDTPTYCAESYTGTPGAGEFFPARIDYTGTAQGAPLSSSVRFMYAARTDTSIGYVGGSATSSTVRLTNVQVFEAGSSIRDYRLSYDPSQTTSSTGRSRLSSLTECDSNLSSANCFPATNFNWSDVTSTNIINNQTWAVANAWGASGFNWTGDFNGDGRMDIASASGANVYVKLPTGTGFTSQTWPVTNAWGGSGYNWVGDFNSDGKSDIASASGANVYVKLSTGTGFTSQTWAVANAWGSSQFTWVGDFNGDGKMDIASASGAKVYVKLSTGTGFTSQTWAVANAWGSSQFTWVGDFNGDGKMDIASASGANVYVKLSTGTGFTSQTWPVANAWGASTYNWTGDFNGDGKMDIASAFGANVYVKLSTGTGFTSQTWPVTDAWGDYGLYWIGDFNGDGRMDIASASGVNLYVKLSTGTGFTSQTWPVTNFWGSMDVNWMGDFNGDGKMDIATAAVGAVVIKESSGLSPDNLTTITNGLGAQTTIGYKPLTNSTVYSKGSGAVFPQQDIQAPMYVVQLYNTSDGIGGNYTVTYNYTGARIDLQGRGFVGFSQITSTETVTGISTQTIYSQTWPTIGMATSVTKSYNNATISSVTNTLLNNRYGIANAYYYFPYASQSTATAYELPGGSSNIVSTTTTANTYHSSCATYDYYCDLTSIAVTTTAGSNTYTKTTTNTYDPPNTSSWILGRLNNAKVTSTIPSGATLTRESSFTYNATNGLLETETVEPNGNIGTITNIKQTTTYTYDGFGNKTGATVFGADGISRPATAVNNASSTGAPYAYTAGRFETDLTNAVNQGETRIYDARFGTVSSLTGPNGLSTSWTYDSFGRKQLETRADGTTTGWAYTLCGTTGCPAYAMYYVTQTTSGAPTVTVYYDLLDREIRIQTQGYNGTAIYKDTVYNNLGQVAKVSRPYYSTEVPWWTYFSYDALGRVTSQSLPTQAASAGNPLGTTSYNGLTTTATQYRDGTALTTTQVKDALGQLVSVTDADNKTTSYEYNPFGNLTKVTDPALNTTSMTYDIRGRKLNMTDPDMGYWQYAYNSVGELTKQTDAKGQSVDMFYDTLGRLVTRNEAEGTTTWTYDDTTVSGSKAKGKLSKVTWPGGDSRTYTYDDYGRPKEEKTTLSGTTFTLTTAYDPYSRLDTIKYPTGFEVRNNYGPYGYLSSVTNASTAASYWNAPAYNAAGQTTQFTLGNGLTTVNQYDPATGLIKGISTGVGNSLATQYLTYNYDTLGNAKYRVDGNQSFLTENFNYDNLNRLLSASIVGGGTKSVAYDSIGNIFSKSDIGTYTYDPLHKHAVKTAGTGSYTYDANGNQLTGPNGRLISYTSFNQPLSIAGGGKTDTFTYDGDHQRITGRDADGTNTIYVHPRIDLGAHYEQETKLNGTVVYKSYIYAGKETIGVYTTRSAGLAPDTRYFHKDHLGSIDTITDETGNVAVDANGKLQRFSYDAWGKRRNGNWTDATGPISSLTHHGFTGHEMLDDVGLINMNGRLYAPGLGRFLQADPTVQAPGNPQTLNRYSYAGNNPLTYVDPSGYGFFSKLFKVFKAIVIAAVAIVAAYYAFGMVFSNMLAAGFSSVTAGIVGGAVGGFVGGFLGSGGNLQAGLNGALTGAVFGGIGAYGDQAGWGYGGLGQRTAAHAVGGGVTGRLQGQKFMSGFVSAGASEWVGLGPPKGPKDFAYKMVASAAIGGTASAIGGGKFENGAKTAAYAYLFNEAAGAAIRKLGPDLNLDPPGSTEASYDNRMQNRADVFEFAAHGNRQYVFDGIHGVRLSAGETADLIRSSDAWYAGETVQLFACSTGQGSNSFAQQLSNALTTTVIAPTSDVNVTFFGNYTFHGIDNPGEWKTFRPQ